VNILKTRNQKVQQDWIKQRKKYLKVINDFKNNEPRDRLTKLSEWQLMHFMMQESQQGWSHWLSNIYIMESIPTNLLDELMEAYKSIVLKSLELDIISTKKVGKTVDENRKFKDITVEEKDQTEAMEYRV